MRPARADDIPALLPLLAQLFAVEPDFTFDPDKARAGLAQLLASPRAVVLTLEMAGAVAGLATMQELISTAEGGPVGLIEDVVIAPDARGRGGGRALLAALAALARDRGYTRLQLLADRGNGDALAFYTRLGWSGTRLICLRADP